MNLQELVKSEYHRGGICQFSQNRQKLSEADNEALTALLRDTTKPLVLIQQALEVAGLSVSYTTLRTHRKEGCITCYKSS